MSPGTPRVFLPTLREVDGALVVPILARVRILRELESDLEELRGRLEGEGVSPEDARARAVDMLVPDRVTLGELRGIYGSRYVRLTEGLSRDLVRGVERSALALWAASVVVVETLVMLRIGLLVHPSPFLWPVLALGALTAAAVGAKAFELWVEKDHSAPERGVLRILALAGATLAVGAGGVLADTYRLAATLERAPDLAGPLATEWVLRNCVLLALALLIALAGALAWFVIRQWLALVSSARLEVLGIPPAYTRR
jgi:hypothetical protein